MWQQNGCPECNSSTFTYRTIDGSNHKICFRCGWESTMNKERETAKDNEVSELKKY